MIVQWYFLDTGRGFFIFFLVPGCLLLFVAAASILRRDVFVHYHLLTHSLTKERKREREGYESVMLSLMRIGMQPWRDIYLICFEAVPGYLMQISGEREGKGERYSLIRKKRRRLEILFPKDLSIEGE